MASVTEPCCSYPNIIAKINRFASASIQCIPELGKFVALHFKLWRLGRFLTRSMEIWFEVGIIAYKFACKSGGEIKEIDTRVIIPVSDKAPAFTD